MEANSSNAGIISSSDVLIWFISTRAAIVLLLMVCGIVGNALVLIIYRRDKKLSGAVYIKALAAIDLLSCTLLLPQLPLLELAEDDNQALGIWKIVTLQLSLLQLLYICLQVTMAMDQFVAVFYPFKHMKLRDVINKLMLGIGVILGVLLVFVRHVLVFLVPQWHIIHQALFLCTVTVSLMILLTAYPAVAVKLYQQKRTIKPQASDAQSATGGASHASAAQKPATNLFSRPRAMHAQALKIYTTIFLVFLVANGVVYFVISNGFLWLIYVYFINHTVNPVIYYCFIEKFRQSVKEYWSRLIGR